MINDNTFNIMPNIKLTDKVSDKFVIFDPVKNRLDKLSQEYYNTPYFGWLIMLANPEYDYEYDIPSGVVIRVPYPLNDTLNDYQAKLSEYKRQYVNN